MDVGESEEDACLEVSTRYPSACSSRCNPEKCGERTNAPTSNPPMPPTQRPTQAPTADPPEHCNCRKCTDEIWQRPIRISSTLNLTTCGEYIRDLTEQNFAQEANVCASVALAYPACAACHPNCNVNDSYVSRQSAATSSGGVSPWVWLFLGVVMFFMFMLYYLRKHFYKRKQHSKNKKREEKKGDEEVPTTTDTTDDPDEKDTAKRIPDRP